MPFDYQLNPITKAPEVDYSYLPELKPYLGAPRGMYVGAPGKHGYLRLGFELDAKGKSILRDLERRAPLIVQQELYFDEEMTGLPCVYILNSGAQNCDGDRFQQDFHLKPGAMAWISTGAATKLAEMEENYSAMVQHITLDAGSYLEYMPEPTIPCRHTRFVSDTQLTVDPTATLFYSEIFMAGRKYHNDELYQYDLLSVTTKGTRPDGEELFREKFIIDPRVVSPRQLGIMGQFDVFANVIVMTPREHADRIYAVTDAFIDRQGHRAAGITHLPNGAGLLFKALGMEAGPVKKMVRDFCSIVRQEVKGHPVPAEFPWR